MDENVYQSYNNDTGFPRYLAKVFLWMMAGLLSTALVAYLVYSTRLWVEFIKNPALLFVPIVLEIGTVILLNARIKKMKVTTAYIMFFFYALVSGVTFGIYPLIYGVQSIFLAFGITAVMFGSMAAIGLTTSIDFSKIKSVLFIGLIFLIITGLVNILVKSDMLDTIICFVGVAIFLGLICFDVQKIKANYLASDGNMEMMEKSTVIGALELYLDFINIFVYVLRIIGKRN